MDTKKIRCRLGSYGPGQSPVAGSCEHVHQPSGSIRGEGSGEFLEQLTITFSRRTLPHGVIYRQFQMGIELGPLYTLITLY